MAIDRATPPPDGFEFSGDSARVDRELVHRWLSTDSYWATGRTREVQDAVIANSLNFGIYREGTGEQVAYARAISDLVTFAWLCDVYVDPSVRGLGIGKALVAGVTETLDAIPVRRTMLGTADAQTLYKQYGFEVLAEPGNWMARKAAARPERS
jgi:GNAT superfamily N-acetyltransferase